MGVDISGNNPVVVSQRPDSIDYSTATEEDKEAYWKALDKYNEENPGVYFGANWWSWRPIHMLCELAQQEYKLRINTTGWGDNSGNGLKNQEKCNQLADALEKYISKNIYGELKEDDDRIYINLGCWSDKDGKMLSSPIEEELQKEYPFGTVLFNAVVLEDGTLAYPSHGSSYGHIKSWIAFLRNCGGFSIY